MMSPEEIDRRIRARRADERKAFFLVAFLVFTASIGAFKCGRDIQRAREVSGFRIDGGSR